MSLRFKTYLQFCLLAVITLGTFALPLAVQSKAPKAQDLPIVVLSSPWSDPSAAILAAGGDPIGPERALFGTFATSKNPLFRQSLAAKGYWTIESATVVNIFCAEL